MTVIAALLLPVAVRLNVTLMLQWAPGLTVLGQLLVWEKSPLLVPVTAMLVMVSGPVPVLLSFAVFCALVVPTFCVPNESDVGEVSAGAAPVPVRLTVCGLPPALSAIVRVALRAAAGNARGRAALPRNLLPGRQLDLSGADHRAGPHGPGTQSPRSSHQRQSTCTRWSAMPGNAYGDLGR